MMMIGFKDFLQNLFETQAKEEVKDTINKLPKAHRDLIRGYKFKFEGGCTLNGSDDNIGMIHLNNDKKKEIHVAAPWNYSRSFTVLHEIAHLVYENLCSKEWKAKWRKIVKQHKKRQDQNNEELWCHAYANHFVKNKVVLHTHPAWEKYMDEFCKATHE